MTCYPYVLAMEKVDGSIARRLTDKAFNVFALP